MCKAVAGHPLPPLFILNSYPQASLWLMLVTCHAVWPSHSWVAGICIFIVLPLLGQGCKIKMEEPMWDHRSQWAMPPHHCDSSLFPRHKMHRPPGSSYSYSPGNLAIRETQHHRVALMCCRAMPLRGASHRPKPMYQMGLV